LVGTGGDGVERSPDGVAWSIAKAGLGNDTVLSMVLAGTTVIARTPYGLRKSQDKGLHWFQADKGVERVRILSMSATDSEVFIGSTQGMLYVSRDFGESWQPVQGSLDSLGIQSLTHDATYLYAGTEGRGIWKRRLDDIFPSPMRNKGESGSGIDARFLPGMKAIELNLRTAADVVSETFDLSGRRLFRLAAPSMEAGTHLLPLTVRASQGVVLYRLRVGKASREFRLVSVD
jgi:hypothetical protein